MSINLSFSEVMEIFADSLKYNMMQAIIFCSIVLALTLILEPERGRYFILIINVILFVLILKYYIGDIFKFQFSNPMHNIYFYFFNSIIYLILFEIDILSKWGSKWDYMHYPFFLILSSYSIFMTDYLGNVTNIVILNIYPMILFGNIIIFIYYLIFLTKLGYHVILKTTSKRSGKL